LVSFILRGGDATAEEASPLAVSEGVLFRSKFLALAETDADRREEDCGAGAAGIFFLRGVLLPLLRLLLVFAVVSASNRSGSISARCWLVTFSNRVSCCPSSCCELGSRPHEKGSSNSSTHRVAKASRAFRVGSWIGRAEQSAAPALLLFRPIPPLPMPPAIPIPTVLPMPVLVLLVAVGGGGVPKSTTRTPLLVWLLLPLLLLVWPLLPLDDVSDRDGGQSSSRACR